MAPHANAEIVRHAHLAKKSGMYLLLHLAAAWRQLCLLCTKTISFVGRNCTPERFAGAPGMAACSRESSALRMGAAANSSRRLSKPCVGVSASCRGCSSPVSAGLRVACHPVRSVQVCWVAILVRQALLDDGHTQPGSSAEQRHCKWSSLGASNDKQLLLSCSSPFLGFFWGPGLLFMAQATVVLADISQGARLGLLAQHSVVGGGLHMRGHDTAS